MKKTYTQTFTIRDLTKATIELEVFDGNKYADDFNELAGKKVKYTGVKAWSIINGEDADKIEAESDGTCIDENHEYLILQFADGDTATFRNSHVDMWIRK